MSQLSGTLLRRCPWKDGMSKMQEHIFDDVHGGTVRRNCWGDSGLSKCQQFGISPISRLRLWWRPENCCGAYSFHLQP
jgi:hypothetical protein